MKVINWPVGEGNVDGELWGMASQDFEKSGNPIPTRGPTMPKTLLSDPNPPGIFRHSYGPAGYNEHKRPKITLAKCSSSLGFLPSLKNTSQPQTKKIEKGRQIEARVCLFLKTKVKVYIRTVSS